MTQAIFVHDSCYLPQIYIIQMLLLVQQFNRKLLIFNIYGSFAQQTTNQQRFFFSNIQQYLKIYVTNYIRIHCKLLSMQPQNKNWIYTTGSQSINSWSNFLSRMRQLRPKSKGQYHLECLPYNQHTIDRENRKNFIQRFISSSQDSGCRHYLLYMPENPKPKMPLIILLHGTGSTMLTTQLIFVMQNKTVWMDLADKQGFIIAVPQSRTVTIHNTKHIVWQAGNQDLIYIGDIIRDLLNRRNGQGQAVIDKNHINFVGKSNGGLFVSELYMLYTGTESQDIVKKLQFRPNLFCNYMGGIEHEQPDRQILSFDPKMKQTAMLIMTCPGQDNYRPCLRANYLLSHHGCNIKYKQINHNKHEFLPECAKQIYEYAKEVYNKRMKLLGS